MNSSLGPERVRGTVLLNSSGAMNNKGVVADIRIVLVYPIFLLIDLLLSIRPVARFLFDKCVVLISPCGAPAPHAAPMPRLHSPELSLPLSSERLPPERCRLNNIQRRALDADHCPRRC